MKDGGIPAGSNRAKQLIYTVPAGKIVFINHIAFSATDVSTGKTLRFFTRATFDDKLPGIVPFFQDFSEISLYNTTVDRMLDPPTKLIGGVDLKITALATDSSCIGACAVRGWIEPSTI